MFIDGLHTKSSNIKNHFLNSSLEDILSVSMNLKIFFSGSRGGTTTTCHQDDTKKEELLLEIQRLRERIKCLETDNASVHNQLSKTQKDVNQRLAEIEMQIHEEEFSFDGNPSPKSSEEEEENNRESFI